MEAEAEVTEAVSLIISLAGVPGRCEFPGFPGADTTLEMGVGDGEAERASIFIDEGTTLNVFGMPRDAMTVALSAPEGVGKGGNLEVSANSSNLSTPSFGWKEVAPEFGADCVKDLIWLPFID
jgi:hypothetical protein